MPSEWRTRLYRAVEDGVVIAGILFAWVALAGVGVWLTYVASMDGTLVYTLGETLTKVFVVTGLANVALYVLARGIALGRSGAFGARPSGR